MCFSEIDCPPARQTTKTVIKNDVCHYFKTIHHAVYGNIASARSVEISVSLARTRGGNGSLEKKKIKKKKRQTRLSAANQKRQFLPRRSKRVRAGDKSVVKINCFFSFFSVCPNPENECGLADTRKGRSCFTTARRSPRQRKNKNNYYQETHDWTVARRGGVVTEVCV